MVLLNCIRHQHNAARTSYELPAPCRSYSLWAYGAMPRLCTGPTAQCRGGVFGLRRGAVASMCSVNVGGMHARRPVGLCWGVL